MIAASLNMQKRWHNQSMHLRVPPERSCHSQSNTFSMHDSMFPISKRCVKVSHIHHRADNTIRTESELKALYIILFRIIYLYIVLLYTIEFGIISTNHKLAQNSPKLTQNGQIQKLGVTIRQSLMSKKLQ